MIVSIISIAQSTINHTLYHELEAKNRAYKVHLPPNYDSTQSYSLVINMHGFGGTNTSQMNYTQFNTIADTGNFIVVYPQGLVGTTSWGWTNTQWNAYYGTGTKDLEFLDTLIDQMYYDYNIDLSRVYSTGHSNGGYMSYRLACELSDRIAAIASVGGAMAFQQEGNCNITHPMPIMQIHGTDDQTVFFDGQPGLNSSIPDLIDYWKDKNNCTSDSILDSIPNTNLGDSTTAIIEDYNMCDSLSNVVLITVENGGHTWPGAIPYPSSGNTCQDFNASSTIWNFFNKYQVENPTMPEPVPIVDTTTSINEFYTDFEIYPNPFNNELMIKLDNNKTVNVKIIGVEGKTFFEEKGTKLASV